MITELSNSNGLFYFPPNFSELTLLFFYTEDYGTFFKKQSEIGWTSPGHFNLYWPEKNGTTPFKADVLQQNQLC